MRKNILSILLILFLFNIAGVVRAGVGTEDLDNEYPHVGVMVIFDLDLPEWPIGTNVSTFCSGVLISEYHFLTAAHCIDWISTVNNPFVGVSFANFAAPIIGTMIPVTEYFMHPAYPPGQWVSPGNSPGPGFGLQNDLGLVVLASPQPITAASLPSEGYLNELAKKGGLVGRPIVNVGYGVVPSLTGPPGNSPPDGVRRVSTSRFVGLSQNFLRQRQNLNAGDEGGSAPGDSGSPKFLPNDTTILAITSWGDAAQRGFGASVRVDTPEALSFINSLLQP